MSIWIGKITLLLGVTATIVIRAPHGGRRKTVRVVESRQGPLELVLMALMWLGTIILPILWIATPVFSFADYPLRPFPYGIGVACLAAGQWLFYRSHRDLGTNWSISLNLRENHTLVTSGVYRNIRHPMYASIFLTSTGQLLVASNWLVGPFELCAFTLMFLLRLGPEEQMMLEQFGPRYEEYVRNSKRLIPGIW